MSKKIVRMNTTRYDGTASAASRSASDGVPTRSETIHQLGHTIDEPEPAGHLADTVVALFDSFGDVGSSFREVVDLELQFGDVGRAHRQPDRQHGEEDKHDRQRSWQQAVELFHQWREQQGGDDRGDPPSEHDAGGDEHVADDHDDEDDTRRVDQQRPVRPDTGGGTDDFSFLGRRRVGRFGRVDAASSAIAVLYRGVPDRQLPTCEPT